ncbi:YjgN family protein [Acidovorax sp.]|uniref:YjgN family protein n=1 Tax=Acidovorax sp. TaxID=1872122 RepID=UPI002ACD8877|nr:YjgN family protein [Acidovorax sp.]MDZ7866099.1 YjgN family protein [Acidovorax sp.]
MDHQQSGAGAAPVSNFAQEIGAHPLEFTGSGGEYFRVWIVNVLLTILTLGFYTPWARRRTAQYFYGHTLVAGSPLEFTAQQRRMVMGFVMLVMITIAYNIAVNTGQDTAVSLFLLAGALLAPFIWGSAMRFRLGSTRWRGLRLQFTASWREVYVASWPVFAIALVWIGVFFGIQYLAPESAGALQELAADDSGEADLPTMTAAIWGLLVLGLLLSVLCFIRLEYNYKSLLVLRAQVGDESGRWKPVYLDFIKVWAATVAVFLLFVVGISAGLAVLAGGSFALFAGLKDKWGALILVVFAVAFIAGVFLLFLASAPARAYREARMFQLMWDNIGLSQVARFKCQLRTGRYVLLRIKNLFLTLLTLGLYRPFARVSEYRMKVESVTLHVKGSVDQVTGAMVRQQQQGGIGDALADAAGLDLIG